MEDTTEKETLQLKLNSLRSLVKNLKSKKNSVGLEPQQPPLASRVMVSSTKAFPEKVHSEKQATYQSSNRLARSTSTKAPQHKHLTDSLKWHRTSSSPNFIDHVTKSSPIVEKDVSLFMHLRQSSSFHINYGSCSPNPSGFSLRKEGSHNIRKTSSSPQIPSPQLPFKVDNRVRESLTCKTQRSMNVLTHERIDAGLLLKRHVVHRNSHGQKVWIKGNKQDIEKPKLATGRLNNMLPVKVKKAATGESLRNALITSRSNVYHAGPVQSCLHAINYKPLFKPKHRGTQMHHLKVLPMTKCPYRKVNLNKGRHKGMHSWRSPTLRSSSKIIPNVTLKLENFFILKRHKLVNRHIYVRKGASFSERRARLVSQGRYKMLLSGSNGTSKRAPHNHTYQAAHLIARNQKRPSTTFSRRRSGSIGQTSVAVPKLQLQSQRSSRRSTHVKGSNVSTTSWKADKILVRTSGNTFQTAKKGRSLKRIRSREESEAPRLASEPIIKKVKIGMTSSQHINKMQTASHLLRRSIFQLTRYKEEKNNSSRYCKFYNRFGKCRKGKSCPFIHDPEKVAICTRFLRGKCNDEKCLFSHKVEQHKMPTCSYFLRAACTREHCPYVHVKVGCKADICKDFLQGCCPKGKECKRKHVLICDEFESSGSCKEGRKCQLYHRVARHSVKRRHSSDTRIPKALQSRNISTNVPSMSGQQGSGELQIQPKALLGLTKE